MVQKILLNLTFFARSLVFAGVVLLPIVALPQTVAPLNSVKTALLVLVSFVPLCVWLLLALVERKTVVPWHSMLAGALAVVVTTLLSSLFSSAPALSLVGHGYERDTFFVIAGLMSLIVIIPWLFRGARALHDLFISVLGVFAFIAVIQIVRIFTGAEFLASWFGPSLTGTPLGSWNDLAAYAGFAAVGSITFLLFYPADRIARVGMSALTVLSMLILVLVNVQIVWATIAFVAFFLLIYRLSRTPVEHVENSLHTEKHSPRVGFILSGIVFLCALVFLLFGTFLGTRIAQTLGLEYVDVRPSWQGTLAVSSAVYESGQTLLGSGPATFGFAWTAFKERAINESLFWDADFAFGVGMLPTFFSTGGVVGGLAWVFFMCAWAYGAIQFLRLKTSEHIPHAVSVIWLAVSGYMLALFVLFIPQTTMLVLMSVSIGAFLATLLTLHVVQKVSIEANQNPVTAFVAPAVLALLLIGMVALCVYGIRPIVSSVYATRAAYAASINDLSTSEVLTQKASWWYYSDDVAQVETRIKLARIAEVFRATPEGEEPNNEAVAALVTQAVSSAQYATQVAPGNVRNWISLARTYEELSPVVGAEAFGSARVAYAEAEKRAPTHPAIPLFLARLSFVEGNTEEARTYIQESLARKSNYTDAYFLLSQIAIREEKTAEAIQSTESAVLLAPNNPGLRFQLGFLHYATGNYESAARMLETAVQLNPQYANALYFLGLSYDRLGEAEKALAVFTTVLENNTDNTEVIAIVEGLKKGISAITTLESLQVAAPDERKELPLSETNTPVVE